ncbi:MAG: hypothetical protein AAGA10_28550 [Bacteroidota bacterium]
MNNVLHNFFILLLMGCATNTVQDHSPQSSEVKIVEGTYMNRPHFLIQTESATYYYDRKGGGISRMIDRQGKDWIAFGKEPWDEYPASAASSFRGIPNLVFRSEDSGAGHPGHDQCQSKIIGDTAILTTSLSERWQWKWTFHPSHAELEVLRVDPHHPYWFLYEGTPGGVFDPQHQYIGTDIGGPWDTAWDYYAGDILYGQWRFVYLGHKQVDRVLFISQQDPDTLTDTFSYLGNSEKGNQAPNGMVVLGLGRAEGAKPLMQKPNVFTLGFIERKVENVEAHDSLKQQLKVLLSNKL